MIAPNPFSLSSQTRLNDVLSAFPSEPHHRAEPPPPEDNRFREMMSERRQESEPPNQKTDEPQARKEATATDKEAPPHLEREPTNRIDRMDRREALKNPEPKNPSESNEEEPSSQPTSPGFGFERLRALLASLQVHLKNHPEAFDGLPKGLASFLRSASLDRLNELLKGLKPTEASGLFKSIADLLKGSGLESKDGLKALLNSKAFADALKELKTLSEADAVASKPRLSSKVAKEGFGFESASSPSPWLKESTVRPDLRGNSRSQNPTHSTLQQLQKGSVDAQAQAGANAAATNPSSTSHGGQFDFGSASKNGNPNSQQALFNASSNNAFLREAKGSGAQGQSSNGDLLPNAFKSSPSSPWGRVQFAGSGSSSVNQHALVERLTQQIRSAVVQGRETLQLSLKPDFLGRVSIFLSKSNGKVFGKLLVDNPAVKELLESKMSEIVEQLRGQKVELNALEIDVNQQGKKAFDFGSSSDNQSNSFYERSGASRPKNGPPENEINLDLRQVEHQLNIII